MEKKYTPISALGLCMRHAPGSTAANIALNAIGGLLPPAMVYIVAAFIDAAVTLASDAPQTQALFTSAALMLCGYLYNQFSQPLLRLSNKGIETRLRAKVRPDMVKKQAILHFHLMEDNETLDLIALVCGNMEQKFIGIVSDFTTAVRLTIEIVGVLGILVSYVWWILPLFLFGTVPLALLSFRGGEAVHEMDRQSSKLTRMLYYLSDVLSGREAAAERALFGFTQGINEKFKSVHLRRSNLVTKEIGYWDIRWGACSIVMNVFALISMAVLIDRVSAGGMTAGLYISIAGALIGLARALSHSFADLLYNFSGHTAYMRDYTRFFALPGDEAVLEHTPKQLFFERLEIRNLWFRYKDTDDYVLKGVNLCLEAGTSYSLIGHNGAGKTTLTKLITGLYRDFEGDILLNGKDIREYSPDDLRSVFSIIYQDYAKYYIPVKDNITFGEAADNFDGIVQSTELHSVFSALPQGADTPLGKILEGGADVSGGEWQKIAIARAVYKNCPFMILDEPTASLSPMMESKVYHQFADISAGHTQLLISHRLGSTKLSDTVLVLSRGVIAEAGPHSELMAQNGIYAEMFESQRSWYREAG